jgi:ELWxxDGT repeat protein
MKRIYKKFILALALILISNAGYSQTLLKDIIPGTGSSYPSVFFEYKGKVFFGANNQFWSTDGTTDGTVMVKEVDFASDEIGYIIFNDMIYFNGDDGVLDRQLWKSDGTTDGTVLVKEIYPGNSSATAYFKEVNGKFVFRAQNGGVDGVTNGNHELWVSNGTTDGTALLKEINPTDIGSLIAGTTLFNGKVYFVANDGTTGLEPWVTDGTLEGTVMLKDISASDNGEPSEPKFTVWGDKLVFTSESDDYGIETWITDGTADGTHILKNIAAGTDNSGPSYYTPNVWTMYFKAGDAGANFGKELWKTDGTEQGTVMIKDIYEGSSGSGLEDFIIFGDKLYFQANDGINGTELWVSDGTSEGTYMLKDIYSGSSSSSPWGFIIIKDKLFFSAYSLDYGSEFWRTDGTERGTVLVKDLNAGTSDSYPQEFCLSGNDLFFEAYDAINGYEPWHATILNITTQPESLYSIIAGTDQTFTVEAVGEGTLTYRWQKNGVDLYDDLIKFNSGVTTNTLTITGVSETDQGIYSCIVTDEFYGSIKSENAVLGFGAAQIKEISNSVKIFPNPAKDYFKIELPANNSFVNIKITNVTGKEILNINSTKQTEEFNTSYFANGVYFIRISNENINITEKIVVE